MIPVQTESDEKLRARFLKSLEKIWDSALIDQNPEEADRPGLHRTHIFDFKDGWRLIVSKEVACGEELIHFSTSCQHKHPYSYTLTDCIFDSLAHWFNLSQRFNDRPQFLGLTERGVAHFIIKGST